MSTFEHAHGSAPIGVNTAEASGLRFSAFDVVVGSFLALSLFAGSLAFITVWWFVILATCGLASGGASTDSTLASIRSDAWGAASAVIVIFLFALFCVVIITGLTLMVFGPIAGLLSLALRRLRAWPLHLVAYFLLGVVAAWSVVMISLHTVDLASIIANPFADALAVLAGASAAGGWAIAWRLAVKHAHARI